MSKRDLAAFEVVLAVAGRKSFKAAATELDMSTSAVSTIVAGLEASLGTRLFHRTTRSVSLTEAGQEFIDQITPAVMQIQDAIRIASLRKTKPSGSLRINSSLGAALMIVKPLLLEFSRRYPEVTVDIVAEGRLLDIIAEGFDAGIRPATLVPQDMIRVPLISEVRMVVVASADYLQRFGTPYEPADLLKHSCIKGRMPGGGPSPWSFVQGSVQLHLDVPGTLVLDSALLMTEAARHGMGLAQVAHWYVQDDLASGRLTSVLEKYCAPAPGLCLYYSGHRHLPAGLRALIELIHELRDKNK